MTGSERPRKGTRADLPEPTGLARKHRPSMPWWHAKRTSILALE
jgi:hypothetical protein